MKKLLAVLLAVVLCVSVCSISAFAANEEFVVTAQGGTASRGGTITVPIVVEKNVGWRALDIRVSYDADVLEIECPNHDDSKDCVGKRAPSVTKLGKEDFEMAVEYDVSNSAVNPPSHTTYPYSIAWAFATIKEDITETGTYATVTFKVKDDAAFGETKVDIEVQTITNCAYAHPTALANDATITIACTNHEAGTPVVVEPAKCDKPGTQTISCKHCGAPMATEQIPPTGHAWGNWEGSAAAECGKPGEEKRVCANDPTHFETRATDALEHLWDDGVVTTPAGCDTPGEKTFTCQRDNTHTKTEPVAPTGHDWDDGVVTTPAGCDTPGETTYTCQNNPSHTKTEPIAPTGHDITWTVTTPPTLDKEGERTGTCGTCGAPFTEPMPKLTNKVDGDKVVGGVVGADGKITEADIDASFETTDDEPFTGYVQGSVIKAPVSTWTDAEKTAVEGKVGVVGFGVAIADTDNAANLDGDKVVKVTIKLDNALLSKYENLVAYAPDASGAMVVLSGAEIVDGNLVVTGKVSDLMGLAVAVYGDEIVVDSGKEPGKSPETGDSSAIAFAIVMMAIAAAAVVVTGKKVKA